MSNNCQKYYEKAYSVKKYCVVISSFVRFGKVKCHLLCLVDDTITANVLAERFKGYALLSVSNYWIAREVNNIDKWWDRRNLYS